jgi:hypothetical protein
MRFSKNNRTGARAHKRRTSSLGLVLAALLLALTLGACGDLLKVDLPGSVTVDRLDDPLLAETLVRTVIGDFECGLPDQTWAGQWMEEWLNTSSGRPSALIGSRATLAEVYADPCDSGTGPIWTIWQVPIQDATLAIELIEGFDQADVDTNKDLLIATARLYEGYSIELLAESFCGVTLLGGPLLSRVEASAQAEDRFTLVIASAAPASAEKDELIAAALIGRARAKLFQGNMAGVVADASDARIPVGFELEATYDFLPGRRNNRIAERNNNATGMMPHRDYLDLTIKADGTLTIDDGEPDPRVVISLTGDGVEVDGPRGVIKYRIQEKFPDEDAEITFSSWREAITMIGEADPAQTVAMINLLRSSSEGLGESIDDTKWPLPVYVSGGAVADRATIVEERRRELWLQNNQAGDKLRWDASGDLTPTSRPLTGDENDGGTQFEPVDEYGQAAAAGRCIRIPQIEIDGNENISR